MDIELTFEDACQMQLAKKGSFRFSIALITTSSSKIRKTIAKPKPICRTNRCLSSATLFDSIDI